jgi:uncharacterized delta-60 repeat protein
MVFVRIPRTSGKFRAARVRFRDFALYKHGSTDCPPPLFMSRFSRLQRLALFILCGALTPFASLLAQSPATFGPDGAVGSCEVQSDGKVLITGAFTRFNGEIVPGIIRLKIDGSLDNTFRPDAATPGGTNLLLRANGRLLYYGADLAVPSAAPLNIARLTVNGAVDQNFTPPASLGYDSVGLAANQRDGKIIVTLNGGSEGFRLVRLNADGSLDSTFKTVRVFYTAAAVSSAEPALAVAIQTDGKILIGGGFNQVNDSLRAGIARIDVDGNLDASYQVTLTPPAFLPTAGGVDSIFLLPDNRAVIGGTFDQVNGEPQRNFARLNPDGSRDTTFAADPATLVANPRLLGVQPDGKALLQLQVVSSAGQPVVRLNPDGTRDAGFVLSVTGGSNPRNPTVYALSILPDGKLVAGGNFTAVNGVIRNNLARLNPDGTLDASFIPGGALPPLSTTVNITATREATLETGTQPGIFVVSRAGGDNSVDLTVNYAISGSAAPGVNYQPLPVNSVIIPAGRTAAKIRVRPFDDNLRTGNLVVRLRLQPGAGYDLGSSVKAKVTIVDTD